jgi:hypothetical protein
MSLEHILHDAYRINCHTCILKSNEMKQLNLPNSNHTSKALILEVVDYQDNNIILYERNAI